MDSLLCYSLWVWASMVLVTDATTATSQLAAYDDLYGDSGGYEAPKAEAAPYHPPAYEPPKYEPPAPAYQPPAPAYQPPAPAYEPPYEQEEYNEKPSGEYDNVPYEEEPMAYVPAATAEVLYVEPCKNNADCGQGICDITYKCRCMDFWWTPNPKHNTRDTAIRPRQFNPKSKRRLQEHGPLVRPCSQKRKSQAEAFLLQLFLGWFGCGCWYLGSGWYGMAVANLIFGCFPLIICLVECACGTLCLCCIGPVVACITKICCCFGFTPYTADKDISVDEAVYNRDMCMNFCYGLASVVALVLWIISLVMIANDCVTGPGIPCVPW
jgi:hypothetical protein